jgi:hypothetical protein
VLNFTLTSCTSAIFRTAPWHVLYFTLISRASAEFNISSCGSAICLIYITGECYIALDSMRKCLHCTLTSLARLYFSMRQGQVVNAHSHNRQVLYFSLRHCKCNISHWHHGHVQYSTLRHGQVLYTTLTSGTTARLGWRSPPRQKQRRTLGMALSVKVGGTTLRSRITSLKSGRIYPGLRLTATRGKVSMRKVLYRIRVPMKQSNAIFQIDNMDKCYISHSLIDKCYMPRSVMRKHYFILPHWLVLHFTFRSCANATFHSSAWASAIFHIDITGKCNVENFVMRKCYSSYWHHWQGTYFVLVHGHVLYVTLPS